VNARVTVALDGPAGLPCPAHLVVRPGALVIADVFTGTVVSFSRGKTLQPLATGLRGATGLAQDAAGTLYVATAEGSGKLWRIRRAGSPPELLAEGLQAPGDLFVDRARRLLVVPDTAAGTLSLFAL
jgi:hypothetical protein